MNKTQIFEKYKKVMAINKAILTPEQPVDEKKQIIDEVLNVVQGMVVNERGPKGFTGPKGEKGDKGDKGEKGDKGDKGDQGERGPKGFAGPRGPSGDQGVRGEKGDKGDKGDPGEKGEKGDRGEKGEKGDRGDQGLRGLVGLQGVKGDKGDIGPKGAPGPKGDKGDPGKSSEIKVEFQGWRYRLLVDGEPTEWIVTSRRKGGGVGNPALLGGLVTSTRVITQNYAMQESNYHIIADATSNAITITMPPSPYDGQMWRISCLNANHQVKVDFNGFKYFTQPLEYVTLKAGENLIVQFNRELGIYT